MVVQTCIVLILVHFPTSAQAVAVFDYKAQEPDELNLNRGDVITDVETQSGGWWEGTLARTGKRGMFPDNFVKVSHKFC